VLIQEAQLLLVLGECIHVIVLKATHKEVDEFWYNATPFIEYFRNSLPLFIVAMTFLVFSTGTFAVMMLTIIKVQTVNYWTGLTTNERFSSQRTLAKKSSYHPSRDGSAAERSIEKSGSGSGVGVPDDLFGADGKQESEVKRLDDIRIEKGLDNTANIDFEGQQRAAGKNKERFKRRATKPTSGRAWLCCKENAKEFKSQKELYDDHLRKNNLREWNDRLIQSQSIHDFIYEKLSKDIKAVDSEVVDPSQPDAF